MKIKSVYIWVKCRLIHFVGFVYRKVCVGVFDICHFFNFIDLKNIVNVYERLRLLDSMSVIF